MSLLKVLHLEELHANGVVELIDENTVVIPITHLSPSPEAFAVEKRIRITYIPARDAYTCSAYYHVYSDKESIECPVFKNTVPLRIALEFLRDNPTHY